MATGVRIMVLFVLAVFDKVCHGNHLNLVGLPNVTDLEHLPQSSGWNHHMRLTLLSENPPASWGWQVLVNMSTMLPLENGLDLRPPYFKVSTKYQVTKISHNLYKLTTEILTPKENDFGSRFFYQLRIRLDARTTQLDVWVEMPEMRKIEKPIVMGSLSVPAADYYTGPDSDEAQIPSLDIIYRRPNDRYKITCSGGCTDSRPLIVTSARTDQQLVSGQRDLLYWWVDERMNVEHFKTDSETERQINTTIQFLNIGKEQYGEYKYLAHLYWQGDREHELELPMMSIKWVFMIHPLTEQPSENETTNKAPVKLGPRPCATSMAKSMRIENGTVYLKQDLVTRGCIRFNMHDARNAEFKLLRASCDNDDDESSNGEEIKAAFGGKNTKNEFAQVEYLIPKATNQEEHRQCLVFRYGKPGFENQDLKLDIYYESDTDYFDNYKELYSD